MALNLEDQENPIDPKKPDLRPVLSKLQGNILKSHGRDYAIHSFSASQATGPSRGNSSTVSQSL